MRAPLALLSAIAVVQACDGGQTVTLGRTEPELEESSILPLVFEDIEAVTELTGEKKDDNPTLSADQTLLCFTSERDGGTGDVDVYCAERNSADDPFDAPIEITVINSPVFESSSALSLDGLTLWFGSARTGGLGGMEIYRSSRASRTDSWPSPELVPSLNSAEDDIPRPPAMGDTLMPMGSRRGGGGEYQTYFALRETADAEFATPESAPDLSPLGLGFGDAQLSEDGLLLVFAMLPDADQPGDLYAAIRASTAEDFGAPLAISGVNTDSDDRDPWLSPDGQTLYFSSDRRGDYEIYRATRAADTANDEP